MTWRSMIKSGVRAYLIWGGKVVIISTHNGDHQRRSTS